MIYIIILTLITLYFIGSHIDKCNEKTNVFTQMKEYVAKEVVYVGNEENSKLTKLYYGEIYKVYDEDDEYIRVYNNRKDPRTGNIIGINLKEDFIKL